MNSEKEKTTLKTYVEQNTGLLTGLAVFIGIAAFSGNLSIKFIALFISIAAILCATMITVELWNQRPRGQLSLTLGIFMFGLLVVALSLLAYCIYFFDGIDFDILFPILTVSFFALVLEILKWFGGRYQKIQQVREWFYGTKVWKFVIALVVFFLCMFPARLIANQVEVPLFKAVVWVATVSNNIKGAIQ